MARKKKHPEHENLERWLVSYADFITLLFATFVVLYALAQADLAQFAQLKVSFDSSASRGSKLSTFMEGQVGVLDSGDGALESSKADAILDSLVLEYLSPKYEEQAFKDIEKEVKKLQKDELKGVNVKIDERGLTIELTEKAFLFASGSAELSNEAKSKLDKIGSIIGKKFLLHLMRVEGHTDSIPFSNAKYASNWELSAGRACSIVRYLIYRFKFTDDLFTAVGFADTRPIADNKNDANRAKNRRVDIVILRNKHKSVEDARDNFLKMDKEQQAEMKQQRAETINRVLNLSDAARLMNAEDNAQKVIILKDGR